ncbi:MAG: hypothetical protein B6I28_04925 [Fusobacteriia bacterium 4572_132]|nr:MAG: hypothetical protein B6I28_04925 [Fusobacteriia bacterium 4572_132]
MGGAIRIELKEYNELQIKFIKESGLCAKEWVDLYAKKYRELSKRCFDLEEIIGRYNKIRENEICTKEDEKIGE